MPNIITLLKLEELSLVDNPANPLAMAPLYKRQSPVEGDNMTDEELEALKADLQKAKDQNEMLRKALIENGFTIRAEGVEKKAEPEFIEIDGEKINKADVPAPILKKMEEAEAQAKELKLVEKAQELLPNVKKEHAKTLIAKFEDADEEFLEFLRSIDAMFSEKMEEVGKASTAEDLKTAEEKMDDLVKAYMEEHGVSKQDKAKAYAAVAKTDKGKELIRKTYKGDE